MERRTSQKRFEDDINVANIIMRHSSKKSIQEPFKTPIAQLYVVVAGASITIITVGKNGKKYCTAEFRKWIFYLTLGIRYRLYTAIFIDFLRKKEYYLFDHKWNYIDNLKNWLAHCEHSCRWVRKAVRTMIWLHWTLQCVVGWQRIELLMNEGVLMYSGATKKLNAKTWCVLSFTESAVSAIA